MAENYIFNLLKPIEDPKTSWDKVYDWIVGKARVALLIIEILMVLILFARVVVDNIGKNNLQEFEEVQLELAALENQHENEFRNIQARVLDYEYLWSDSNAFYEVLSEVNDYIGTPSGPITVTVSHSGTVSIEGYESLNSLRLIEQRMKQSETFEDVVIDTLSLDQTDIQQGSGRYSLTAFLDIENFRREEI
jgi:hypothetical protein